MRYQPQDHFFKRAKKENFVARSIFKLEEIDVKFQLFKPHQTILDLGASPGSWSQYVLKKIGPAGKIVAYDLKPMEIKSPQIKFHQKSIFETSWGPTHANAFDLVLSDMAPNTTGIKSTDQARSFDLCQLAFEISLTTLKSKGHFICKLFHSDDFQVLKTEIKKHFQEFHAVKPNSTRQMSKEIFLVGLKKKL